MDWTGLAWRLIGARRGQKRSADREIGDIGEDIGFVLRGSKNGCIELDIASPDRVDGQTLLRVAPYRSLFSIVLSLIPIVLAPASFLSPAQ